MSFLKQTDPEVFSAIQKETERLEYNLELIASENVVSEAVLEAQGSVMTNKYAEGYPGKRYYGGCENVDVVEELAISRAKQLFGADHVNVQPHSGSQANMAVYFSQLAPGDTILSMDLTHGGHLTHGSPVNFSGKFFKVVPYGVRQSDERIDYEAMASLARQHRPKMIVVGYSAYPREIDFRPFREAADEVGAVVMVDIAHFAGLVAAGIHPSPIPHAEFVTTTTHKTLRGPRGGMIKIGAVVMVDIAHFAGLVAAGIHPSPIPHAEFVTTTTHKTLRGPRGGMIMCRAAFAKTLNSSVFPGNQGGPLMHVIAAKAVALKEALTPEFKLYQQQIVRNAKALAGALMEKGFGLISGGTDNHLMLVDLRKSELTGKGAQETLDKARITVNRNTVPFETRSPFVTRSEEQRLNS